jgi:hypothetical protein
LRCPPFPNGQNAVPKIGGGDSFQRRERRSAQRAGFQVYLNPAAGATWMHVASFI